MKATPLAGIPEAIEIINSSQHTNLALISGRPVAEVQTLIHNDDIVIAGTHGWELYTPENGVGSPSISRQQQEQLVFAYEEANRLIEQQHIERKLATVAVHTRALPAKQAQRLTQDINELWEGNSQSGEVEIRKFDGGIEFRIVGRTKANAVEEILSMWPESQLTVYVGDDDTDEDAFSYLKSELRDRGLGIRVGESDRASAAQGRLYSVEEVRQFLWDWINNTM